MQYSPRIAIIGTGAMACLFASRLAPHASVTLVGSWQQQIDTLTESGLTVIELDGVRTQHQLCATSTPENIEPVDCAIVLTKSYQTVEAIERVAACLTDDGIIITLQNGLGNLEQFVERFGTNRVTAGVTAMGATLLQPGLLRHAGSGMTRVASSASIKRRLLSVLNLFDSAEIPTVTAPNAQTLLWGKVIINAAINPLTALLNVSNGELAANPSTRDLMQQVALEAASVADALKIALPYNDVLGEVLRIAKATASNHSSMLQDIQRQAPTEIDAICGAVVRAGEQVGIATPLNQKLWETVISVHRELDESAESQAAYTPSQNIIPILTTLSIH